MLVKLQTDSYLQLITSLQTMVMLFMLEADQKLDLQMLESMAVIQRALKFVVATVIQIVVFVAAVLRIDWLSILAINRTLYFVGQMV